MAGMSALPRRRFQFSLTSLLLVITLVAIWLAWEFSFIRERQAWVRENAALADGAAVPMPPLTLAPGVSINITPAVPPAQGGSSFTLSVPPATAHGIQFDLRTKQLAAERVGRIGRPVAARFSLVYATSKHPFI
jgi:hypothetical protein